MTDAADIRRAVERAGVRGFARRAGCPPAAVQRLVKRGAYPERGPHGAAMRAAVAAVLAESGPAPEPGPELVTVPARFAATARFLAGPSMAAADVPDVRAVADALVRLAADCGYTLEPHWSSYAYAPHALPWFVLRR